MGWVRIHPFIPQWPGGGPPPVFEINSGENGSAIVELAWDPQALLAPATYPDLLRYYNSAMGLSGSITRDAGGTMSVSVPAETITLNANRATWRMPQALWDAYIEESFKTLRTPATTTFSRNLYYRVTVTPPGGARSDIWPSDGTLGRPNATAPAPNNSGRIDAASAAAAPHIGILTLSATPGSRVVPDTAAINAAGGISLMPRLWSDLLLALWNGLPEADPARQSLAGVFTHPTFTAMTVPERGMVLRLWLLSSTVRPLFRDLLSRQAITGSGGPTMPILKKTALRGGKTMLELLLDLINIPIHPDLVAFTRDQLVADVLHEVLDPNGRVNQGAAGTCAPTSVQTMLINVNPAEYVRLMTGLLSTTSRAELANGAAFTVPRGTLQMARYTGAAAVGSGGFHARNYSELAFQGAGIKFSYGTSFPADAGDEASAVAMFNFVHGNGLFDHQMLALLKAVFNVNFTQATLPAAESAALIPVQTANTASLIAAMANRPPLLVAMWWGSTSPRLPSSSPRSAHAVVALRHENGRLFFKNPQYAGTFPPPASANGGTASGTPPRRYEDVRSTLESMADADVREWIMTYYTPDTALI